MPKIKHQSTRRAPPLKDSDCDHEIKLIDHSAPVPETTTAETEATQASSSNPVRASSSQSQDHDRPEEESIATEALQNVGNEASLQVAEQLSSNGGQTVDGPPKPTQSTRPTTTESPDPETVIDILYENQRGGFLCGMALFASKALGNLDPAPWTNLAGRPSPTDIHTAQVPDPSWGWVWPEWRINHEDGVDEDGWEYSFMFAKQFSWHGPAWWNSFVRRRAWTRKRVKKKLEDAAHDPYMPYAGAFPIATATEYALDRTETTTRLIPNTTTAKASMDTSGSTEGLDGSRIEDIDELLRVLRASRIDREKIEAINNYLDNGHEDLVHLQDEMHEIMALFVFQASRRVLLARLTDLYDQATASEQDNPENNAENRQKMERKTQSLLAAIKHGDEEVRKLEFWSDVKDMAIEGESGAVDRHQGWDPSWQGLDNSGPKGPEPKE